MKKYFRSLISHFLTVSLLLSLIVLPAAAVKAEDAPAEPTELVIAEDSFSGTFSPFFSSLKPDSEIVSLVNTRLFSCDRSGVLVTHGIEGETRFYAGTDYTYYGPADLDVSYDEAAGGWCYDITLLDGLMFSDGTPLTADDVIFTMYVLADPTYNGTASFRSLPILGMNEYRANMDTLLNLLYQAGRDNADYTFWTAQEQAAFWEGYDGMLLALVDEICDYCRNYEVQEGDYTGAAAAWGYNITENSAEAFARELDLACAGDYGGNILDLIRFESAGSSAEDLWPGITAYSWKGIRIGESAESIPGIQKLDDRHIRIVMTRSDAAAITHLCFDIAPLHYYGNAEEYDFENNKFGFSKGDLTGIRVKAVPVGAGPYKFVNYDGEAVTLRANEYYYKGKPLTNTLIFRSSVNSSLADPVIEGTADVAYPMLTAENAQKIRAANSSGELSGDVLHTFSYDYPGYGYIGISALNVMVGDDPGSDASKFLRKAFAVVLGVYREDATEAFYGDAAEVINYPISNTSWAAPYPEEEGYEIAFSKDANGGDIYASENKYQAALDAALQYLELAGYTVENGTVTAAPEGGRTEFTILIPGGGVGDHPMFGLANSASEALAEIGITLNVNDITNSSALWDGLSNNEVDLWAAAWSSAIDPDMYQVYYSDTVNSADGGASHLCGPNAGGSNYMYDIADAWLDDLILQARASDDQAVRRPLYRQCLDIIMDWAVEIPVYQRQEAVLFSAERVDISSVTPDITSYYGWMNEIENVRSFVSSSDPCSAGHTWDEGTVTTAPTCTEAGIKTYFCTVCGKEKTEEIPAAGHTYKSIVTKATTTTNGSVKKTCSVCGHVASTTTIYKASKITLSCSSYTYNGKVRKPTVSVKDSKGNAISTSYYTIKYSNDSSTKAGSYTVTVSFKGRYGGDKKILTYKIAKAANKVVKMTTSKTIKYSALKSKTQTFTISATVKESAKKTFKLTSVPSKAKNYITVSSAGKVTVKKGLAKGTYKIKVSITTAATTNYKKTTITNKTISIKVG